MTNIKRRTMLHGFGLCMGLPLLDIMHSTSRATGVTSNNPTRMAFVFFANGAIMDSWKPKTEGAEYELPRTLQQLKEHKSEINVVTGLAQNWGRAHGDGPGHTLIKPPVRTLKLAFPLTKLPRIELERARGFPRWNLG